MTPRPADRLEREEAPVPRWPVAVAERATRSHGRRTLQVVLDAAVAELADHGFHGARMARIARRAGVAHGTVYVYLADKDDLLAALQRDVDAELSAALLAMPPLAASGPGRAEVERWMLATCAVFQRHGAVLEALAEALTDDQRSVAGRAALRSMGRTTAHIAARVREVSPSGVDPDIAAVVIFAAIEGLNRARYRGDLELGEDQVAAELCRFVVTAVGAA